MFEKSDDAIRTLRNLNSNLSSLENQYSKNQNASNIYKINEHIITPPTYTSISQSQSEFRNALDFDRDLTLDIMNASNIFSSEQIHSDRFNKFARYGIIDIYNENMGTREYLFFSKPDLHIFNVNKPMELYEPLKQVPFFANAVKQYPESLLSLQQTFNDTRSSSYANGFNIRNKFIPLLSNHVSSTLDLPTISATETQNNANLYQIGTSYRDGSEISDCSYEFSLEFKEDKYLDVYMFFKAYDEYFRQKYQREIRPTKISYIDNRINSDQFSVWKIITNEANGIVFYAKSTAINPISVPRDVMSNLETPIRISVNFKGQFIGDMNPIHLNELNHLTELTLGKTSDEMIEYVHSNGLHLYNKNNWVPNTEWGSCPYIIKSGKRVDATEKEGDFYRLIWIR